MLRSCALALTLSAGCVEEAVDTAEGLPNWTIDEISMASELDGTVKVLGRARLNHAEGAGGTTLYVLMTDQDGNEGYQLNMVGEELAEGEETGWVIAFPPREDELWTSVCASIQGEPDSTLAEGADLGCLER